MELQTSRKAIQTIIPAQPGWYVAWPHDHEGDYIGFFLDPIIAWEVGDGDVMPLCPEGRPSDCHTDVEWAIKTPDGKFIFLHANTLDSETKALAYLQGVMKHRRA